MGFRAFLTRLFFVHAIPFRFNILEQLFLVDLAGYISLHFGFRLPKAVPPASG